MNEGWSFAVWISWVENAERFGGWYVNIQEPHRRTDRGLQTMDLTLDVVIESDGTWKWKDQDELEALVEFGAIDAKKAAEIKSAGIAAIHLLEANEPPFNEPWGEWKPNPEWSTPVLPEGWDRID